MKKVIIYTHPDCKESDKVKQVLTRASIRYDERDVSKEVQYKREMIERSGGRKSTPQIFIDGRHCSSVREISELVEDKKTV